MFDENVDEKYCTCDMKAIMLKGKKEVGLNPISASKVWKWETYN